MTSKLLSFVLSSVLFLCLSLAFASALSVSVVSSSFPANVSHNQGSATFTVNVTNNNVSTDAANVNVYADSSLGTVSIPAVALLPANSSQLLTATLTFPSYQSGLISITNIRSNATLNGTLATSSSVSGPNSITILTSNSLSASASVSSVSIAQNSTITVTNTGNTVLSSLNLYSSNSAIVLNSSSISALNPGSSTTFKAYPSFSSTLVLGNPSTSTITINNSAVSASTSVSAEATYCTSGDAGTNLSITDFEISKTDEDYTWMPLQTVEVKFSITNKNADSGDSNNKITTYAAIELYSSTGKKYLSLDKLKVGTINAGDDKLAKFNFTVPADIKEGTAYLYVKAYQSGQESKICTSQVDSSYRKAITINKQSDDDKQIALTDVSFDQQPALCGTSTTLNMKVYNVGDRDQSNVKIALVNKELGINTYTVLSDLNEGDEADVSFPVSVPSNIAAKVYSFDLKVRYDVKDDSDTTLDSSYDYIKLYNPSLIVSGTQCVASNITAGQASSITAEFNSDTPKAVIGQQVIVDATIKNTGTSAATYTVDVAGNSAWSTVATIDPKTFTLNSGESKKVGIYLNINSNSTEGNKEFTIRAVSGSTVTEQKVQVAVEKGLTTATLMNNIKQNWVIYLIIAVNVVLILAIILVVRSLMNKH